MLFKCTRSLGHVSAVSAPLLVPIECPRARFQRFRQPTISCLLLPDAQHNAFGLLNICSLSRWQHGPRRDDEGFKCDPSMLLRTVSILTANFSGLLVCPAESCHA